MATVYHLDLDRKDVKDITLALMPGDPERVEKIAQHISGEYGTPFSRIASKREFTTFEAFIGKRRLLITSTGIGGPSTSIAVDELAQLGIRTFIRVGTTGAIQDNIKNGDVVITTGSVRLDGASTHYAPIEYPAVAHIDAVNALIEGAKATRTPYHAGVTASSDTFYPGEERTDSFMQYKLRRFRGATDELRALHVLNYEMESSTLLTMTSAMGLKGGCVTGVVNRGSTGRITKQALEKGAQSAIKVAVKAAQILLSSAG